MNSVEQPGLGVAASCYGVRYRVVWWIGKNVSEDRASSVVRVEEMFQASYN